MNHDDNYNVFFAVSISLILHYLVYFLFVIETYEMKSVYCTKYVRFATAKDSHFSFSPRCACKCQIAMN